MLDEILAYQKSQLVKIDSKQEIEKMRDKLHTLPPTRSMFKSLQRNDEIAIIAEIKRRSPSKGILAKGLDAVSTAQIYQKAGANAISVLTEEKFFGGSSEDLRQVRQNVDIPVLRKDFIINKYQVWQSRFMGADAILLIVAALRPDKVWDLYKLALKIGLEVIVEVHDSYELDIALGVSADMIGINNRNLETFEINLETTKKLAQIVTKDVFLIGESGIKNREDVCKLHDYGVNGILVGEEIIRSSDRFLKIRELMGKA